MLTTLFGLGAMLSLFLIYQQKKRRNIILCKLSADIFWVLHYFTLGAVGGMIPNLSGIFRELVFVNRKRKRWASTPLWAVFFIAVNFGLGIYSFEKWYDIVPITASAFVTVSLWIDNARLMKLISVPVSLAFFTYDIFVSSYIGMINECIAIVSVIIYFIKNFKGESAMSKNVFSEDFKTSKELIITEGAPIADVQKTLTSEVSEDIVAKGDMFADEIRDRSVSDFEKEGDKMVHVSTFAVIDGYVYMTYYANTKKSTTDGEDPCDQTARLVYAPTDDTDNKTFMDIQTVGDKVGDKVIDMVYDTIMMQKDERTIQLMWTASSEGNYYRFYRTFDTVTKKMGEVGVNRFRVGEVTNDFSTGGIRSALAESSVACKNMYSDIGIMQKMSFREENGERYCYSGAYSGDFTCIIKSKDLVTWEYVSQPDFINDSRWENATYVLNDRVYYFVRQQYTNKSGFLTFYDLKTQKWETPVEIHDCQSRSDFIMYNGSLYLFHAPIDRNHIGIVRVDTENLANSSIVLQAKMHNSCFYPFIQYYRDGELAMSYT
ncbi:MAG: YgjV family protein, partial [Clostridia bacterium]|nr:YgjV family protein [Clostridia bacterium]